MTVRPEPGSRHPGYPQSSPESPSLIHAHELARRHALERAYPLAKQLAEILELEAIEPMATSVTHVRQAIGAALAELGRDAEVVDDGLPCQPISASRSDVDGSSS